MSRKTCNPPPFQDYPLTQVENMLDSQALVSDEEVQVGSDEEATLSADEDSDDDGDNQTFTEGSHSSKTRRSHDLTTPSPVFKGKSHSRKQLVYSDEEEEESLPQDLTSTTHAKLNTTDGQDTGKSQASQKTASSKTISRKTATGQKTSSSSSNAEKTTSFSSHQGPQLHVEAPTCGQRMVTCTPQVTNQPPNPSIKAVRQAEKKRRMERQKSAPLMSMMKTSEEQQLGQEATNSTGLHLDAMPTLMNLAKRAPSAAPGFRPFKIPVSDNQFITLSEIAVGSRGRLDGYKYTAVSFCRKLANGTTFTYSFSLNLLPTILEGLHAIEKATRLQSKE